MVNSIPDCRQTGHDGFDLVRATLNNFNHDGGLFDQPQYSTTGTAGKRLVRVCLGTVNNG